ncbi:MAG TPA: DHA2 family efflux MFS transporter permease subunit [Pseudonocardia sp.]|uniref:DHA2 family efflux MFS transporter permease subunit n=1 Tax=Pseudonocardia sp. TaxID=60912 RepID=UPI002C777793|nr:DHA2 family efflux MFS transporter permease subunit [Pseudonocardia sp.]HTF53948.1 DHA2 family efflux MFS transporter permease subunit [Pseudonocardia sp.]
MSDVRRGYDRPESGVYPGESGGSTATSSASRAAAVTRGRPTRTASPTPPPPVQAPTKWGLPLLVVIVGMFMSVLDTSIVNVAIPTMQGQFSASPDNIQWIATAYTLCLGVVVPTSAWLGERLGLRRTYLLALVLFSAFSALCGTATDLNMMIVYRVLQAIPGGVIPVTCLTILYRMVPPSKLGAAMGLYGLGIVFAPGVGPTLGGYLVEYVDWRLIFYINVPIGILGAIAAMIVLPKFPATPGRPFDVPGFVCIAAACFALLLAVSEGQQWGWTSYPVLMLVAGGFNLLALFVVIELHVKHPLLTLQTFRYWPYVNSLLLMAIVYTGLFSSLYYVPLFLQNVQGITPWNTGLTVMPQALVMAVLTPFAGRLFDKFGARYLVMAGMTIDGIGTLMMAQINTDMSRTAILLRLMVSAAGLALCFMPIMTGGMSSLPPQITSAGSAMTTLVQRVSAAIGLAAVTAFTTIQQAQLFADRSSLLQTTGPDVDPRITQMQGQGPDGLLQLFQELTNKVTTQSYSDAFLLVGICVLAAVPLAYFLPKKRPTGGSSGPVEM